MRKALISGIQSGKIAGLIALGLLPGHNAAAVAMDGAANNPSASDVIELRDGNSVLRTDIFKFNTNEAWFVDGVNTLFTDLYFYNVGQNPAQRELRLEDFEQISLQQPAENQLLFTGQSSVFGGRLNFSLDSTLYGGEEGSFNARREDVIEVLFEGDTDLPFTLISYLRLDSRFDNDILTFKDNTFTQTDASGLQASLTPVNRTPSAVELEEYPFLISRLYDETRTDLGSKVSTLNRSGSASPQAMEESLIGVDGTAALQFDESLAPGQTLTFQFIKQIERKQDSAAVPEPGVIFGLGIVAGSFVLFRRTRA